MTTPEPSHPDASKERVHPDRSQETESVTAERAVLRRALRDTLLLLGALVVLGGGVGALVAGTAGLWGALVGAGLVAFFCGTTIWSMMSTVGAPPARMAAFVMGAWIVKIIVLVAVLALIQDADFYDPWVLLAVLAIGAIGSALLDYRAVKDGRMPYIQP